eukprot:GFUD01014835.1.p1 GENE.GFUD01014835.1~~GFUD01014835.1.p1  ORF type:complete len:477 (+),score=51.22 GFUD01014835.1:228-1658(+)
MAPVQLECIVPNCKVGDEQWKTQALEFEQAKQLLESHVNTVHRAAPDPLTTASPLTTIYTVISTVMFPLKQVIIDSWVFNLYKFTNFILVSCFIPVAIRQFFGESIQCDPAETKGIDGGALNSYCWMYSTWSAPPQYKGAGACSTVTQEDYQNMPIGKWNEHITSNNSYYQWVPLYFFVMGVFFYLPHLLWIRMEGGLVEYLKTTTKRYVNEKKEEKKKTILDFIEYSEYFRANCYFYKFITLEFLNTVIVLVQFAMTSIFLNFQFFTYGFDVLNYKRMSEQEQRAQKDPMCANFPKIAYCDYSRFGAEGMEQINAICTLVLNMIVDKDFLVLWCWLFLQSIIGLLLLSYRLIQIFRPEFRLYLFKLRMTINKWRMNNCFETSLTPKQEKFLTQCKLGDWFILYKLSNNLFDPTDRKCFMAFLTRLSDEHEEEPDVQVQVNSENVERRSRRDTAPREATELLVRNEARPRSLSQGR